MGQTSARRRRKRSRKHSRAPHTGSAPIHSHRVCGGLAADLRRSTATRVAGLCGGGARDRSTYVARRCRRFASRQSADRGRCTAIGHAGSFSAIDAALINGIAAHGEDYDDTFEGGPVHAGAVIVPAVLATGERYGASGDAMLRGLAAGVELMCRLGLVAPMRVHKAGFHPTSVFGAMGSALAPPASRSVSTNANSSMRSGSSAAWPAASSNISPTARGRNAYMPVGRRNPAFVRHCSHAAASSDRARCSKGRTAFSSASPTRAITISRRSSAGSAAPG